MKMLRNTYEAIKYLPMDRLIITSMKWTSGKCQAFLHEKRAGGSHNLLMSTAPEFETEEEAEKVVRQFVGGIRGEENA